MRERCLACNGGVFLVTSLTRTIAREDTVGNISGVKHWSMRYTRVVCEKCGARQTPSSSALESEKP